MSSLFQLYYDFPVLFPVTLFLWVSLIFRVAVKAYTHKDMKNKKRELAVWVLNSLLLATVSVGLFFIFIVVYWRPK